MEAVSCVCQPARLSKEIAGITHRDQHPQSHHQPTNRKVYLLRTSIRSLPNRLPVFLLKVLFEKPAEGHDGFIRIRSSRFNHQESSLCSSE